MNTESSPSVRVMFCIGGQPAFYFAGAKETQLVVDSFVKARGELLDQLNIRVRATFDDDRLKEGPFGWAQTIIADVPDLDSITAYVSGLMRTPIDGLDALVFKYFSIETRIGRPVGVSAREFYGEESPYQIDGVI